jgi:hypothetical protein
MMPSHYQPQNGLSPICSFQFDCHDVQSHVFKEFSYLIYLLRGVSALTYMTVSRIFSNRLDYLIAVTLIAFLLKRLFT